MEIRRRKVAKYIRQMLNYRKIYIRRICR